MTQCKQKPFFPSQCLVCWGETGRSGWRWWRWRNVLSEGGQNFGQGAGGRETGAPEVWKLPVSRKSPLYDLLQPLGAGSPIRVVKLSSKFF